MREQPLNTFTHPIFYRAFHSGLGNETSDGDLRARVYPPPPQLSTAELKKHVDNHGWISQTVPTPLISVTNDTLFAFKVAEDYVNAGKDGVTIVMIDGWRLRDGSFISCKKLSSRLKLEPNNLFATETLVWAEIPHQAILFRWTWSELQGSGLFDLFPFLPQRSRNLQTLRDNIRSENESFSYPQLVDVLVTALQLPPTSLVTKQVCLVMAGWREGYAEVKYHNSLEQLCSSALEFMDSQLHKRAIEIGEIEMKRLRSEEPDPTSESMVRLYLTPDFKEWWMEREESDLGDREAFGYQRRESFLHLTFY